jgi:CBS-domain-containing membrane protein
MEALALAKEIRDNLEADLVELLPTAEVTVGGKRLGWWAWFWLALPPVLTVLADVYLLQRFTHERILFASLASSAFLIYYHPLHTMNSVRVMVTAQLLAGIVGVAGGAIAPGYPATAVTMVITIALLITLHVVHPPAISTALGFSFLTPHLQSILALVAAVGILALLVILQRFALWGYIG